MMFPFTIHRVQEVKTRERRNRVKVVKQYGRSKLDQALHCARESGFLASIKQSI